MRDVTSKRPLTRVISVTRSHSCEMTTFSTGISALYLWQSTIKIDMNDYQWKLLHKKPLNGVLTVVVRR